MNIDELARQKGEWLRGDGHAADIVISSRIRLARNLAEFPFLSKADEAQREEITNRVRDHVAAMTEPNGWTFHDVAAIDGLDQQVLVERHLISRHHADTSGARGVSVSADETRAIMINEEDHLRLQVMRSGLEFDDIWQRINALDDYLDSKVEYAYHNRYGYLTACPTNVGTGIRVSVMLHLPALKLTGEIERVFRAAKDMRLAVRGLFGEGTEATGDFFQVSNQVTLGRTEQEIIDDFRNIVIPKIVEYERHARHTLVSQRPQSLDDRIWRSYGVLKNARMISSEETMLHLSHLRMGVNLDRIPGLDLETINALFILIQPAHLQKNHGARLSGEERSVVRANTIRSALAGTSE